MNDTPKQAQKTLRELWKNDTYRFEYVINSLASLPYLYVWFLSILVIFPVMSMDINQWIKQSTLISIPREWMSPDNFKVMFSIEWTPMIKNLFSMYQLLLSVPTLFILSMLRPLFGKKDFFTLENAHYLEKVTYAFYGVVFTFKSASYVFIYYFFNSVYLPDAALSLTGFMNTLVGTELLVAYILFIISLMFKQAAILKNEQKFTI